jgi:hypothetical protein
MKSNQKLNKKVNGENLTEINLIHKSDVDFEVFDSMLNEKTKSQSKPLLHHGEIYIYQKEIFLYDGLKWYKAEIQDIKGIRSMAHDKKILIKFWDFDLMLSCKDYSHLLALRDFLFLAQKNFSIENLMISDDQSVGGGNI